ncbi:uncharacterized protein LOC127786999 [Diospyros lotus]|uniref:uncharacterized protein LOC127786999 n=1 Tax=Diospyros lotus TaxID=55363 RepID=UPI002254EC59|nr:uncharacterized protein LOC127786999 [Diospyros lotus]
MKVHPQPRTRNVTLRCDIGLACRQRKLRRLPHIFAKVIELPFRSDADVLVEETSGCLRFVVDTDDFGGRARAQSLEIYPGVTKLVVRGTDAIDFSLEAQELDMWRFRLPASTLPELATASYSDGELVVTVPKEVNFAASEEIWVDGNGDDVGAGRFVLVL